MIVEEGIVDVTKHKRTREALVASDDRQQATVDAMDPIAWIMDAESNSLRRSSRWVQEAELSTKHMCNLGWLRRDRPTRD
jgi:PAS domain-containing protein